MTSRRKSPTAPRRSDATTATNPLTDRQHMDATLLLKALLDLGAGPIAELMEQHKIGEWTTLTWSAEDIETTLRMMLAHHRRSGG